MQAKETGIGQVSMTNLEYLILKLPALFEIFQIEEQRNLTQP